MPHRCHTDSNVTTTPCPHYDPAAPLTLFTVQLYRPTPELPEDTITRVVVVRAASREQAIALAHLAIANYAELIGDANDATGYVVDDVAAHTGPYPTAVLVASDVESLVEGAALNVLNLGWSDGIDEVPDHA